LAKMDGAIILTEDMNQVLRANVHLVPDSSLYTSETGMRHRTAERVAKQTKATVISISERRSTVTLFIDNFKYVLKDSREILAKSNQALQTLEKYKKRLDQVSGNLSTLEYEDLVTLLDVVIVLQRSLMVEKVAVEIENYISELGEEGRLLQMQLDELMANVAEESMVLIRDYVINKKDSISVKENLLELSNDEILDLLTIAKHLGYGGGVNILDQKMNPRGFRVLRRIPRLPYSVIDKIVKRFGDLQTILNANHRELDTVDGVGRARAEIIQDNLRKFKESTLMDRYV
ncbi:MAG: DNA integrity scanning protein DisA, partial [Actinobacteria bacterium]